MKIKEIEQNIEYKIIESIVLVTSITYHIDNKNLNSQEKVKWIKKDIERFLNGFNKTFRMSKNNRNLIHCGVPELMCNVEELKTAILEYIMKNNEQSLRYTEDINNLFKDFE